jgi:hypothetical protein
MLDGKVFYFTSATTIRQLWEVPLMNGKKTEITVHTTADVFNFCSVLKERDGNEIHVKGGK